MPRQYYIGMTIASANPKTKRRWFQFSLRTLGALTTLICVGLAWLAHERNEVQKRRAAIEAIEKLGGRVDFDTNQPFRPAWLRPLLADNMPGEALNVLLANTQVSDAGLVHLAGLTKLTYLWLHNTKLTDAGLVHLKDLSNLVSLDLADTQITDSGLVHLAGLTKLTHLSLDSTQVTDAGLAHLTGLTKLEQLDLNNTRVTDAGVSELKRTLPNVAIYHWPAVPLPED